MHRRERRKKQDDDSFHLIWLGQSLEYLIKTLSVCVSIVIKPNVIHVSAALVRTTQNSRQPIGVPTVCDLPQLANKVFVWLTDSAIADAVVSVLGLSCSHRRRKLPLENHRSHHNNRCQNDGDADLHRCVASGLTTKLSRSRRKRACPAMTMFKFHKSFDCPTRAAVACSALFALCAVLRPPTPIMATRPEPNNHAEVGSGTTIMAAPELS